MQWSRHVATTPPPGSSSTTEPVVIAAAAIGDDRGDVVQAAVAAQGTHAVLIARFADPDAAAKVYDGSATAKAPAGTTSTGCWSSTPDEAGEVKVQQMTDHHTRRGTGWGVVAGVIAGILFPPSILASAAVFGGAGAIMGKIGNIRQKQRVEQAVADVITAGTSGILALVSLEDVPVIVASIPEAQEVRTIPVDEATAAAIEQAAGSSEASTAGGPDQPGA